MPLFILMKTVNENEEHGESCNEVVGLYAGAIRVGETSHEAVEVKTMDWIKEYLKFLDPKSRKFSIKKVTCSDDHVVMAFELSESDVPFETVYVYPMKSALYMEASNA